MLYQHVLVVHFVTYYRLRRRLFCEGSSECAKCNVVSVYLRSPSLHRGYVP
jgi:hypothetical protein